MRDTIGRLLDRLTGGRSGGDGVVAGLTAADCRALTEDLASFGKLDAGLVRPLTGHVLHGTDDSAPLRLKNAATAAATKAYFGDNWNEEQAGHRRRAAIFLRLAGWHPAVLKRYGEVLSILIFARWQPNRIPGSAYWSQWLSSLVHMVDLVLGQARADVPPDRPTGMIDVGRLRELLRLDGRGEVELICGLFDAPDNWSRFRILDLLCKSRDLAALTAASPDAAAASLDRIGAQARAKLIAYLTAHDLVGTGVVLDRILKLAADKAASTREAAATALTGVDRTLLAERAAALLGDGDVDVRLAAVRILATIIGPPAAPVLTAHAATESSKKILQAIAESAQAFAVLGGSAAAGGEVGIDDATDYFAVGGERIAIPPTPPLPAESIVPADVHAKLRDAAVAANERARATHAERAAAGSEWHKKHPFRPPFDPSAAADVAAVMRGEAISDERRVLAFNLIFAARAAFAPGTVLAKAFSALLANPDVTLRHIVRLGLMGNRGGSAFSLLDERNPVAPAIIRQLVQARDLRVIDALVGAERKSGNLISDYLRRYLGAAIIDGEEVDRTQLRPWIASNFASLDQAFGIAPGGASAGNEVPAALRLLAFLPAPPRRYLQVLTDLATTGPKATRAQARALLAPAENLTALICALLGSGDQGRRIAAAAWLAERGDTAALPDLHAALGRERTDHGRAAILSALARLGQDIAAYFSDETLLPEARKAIPKLRSKLGEWFPFAALPAVAWSDGRPVQPDILRYWLLLADKLKQPAGNPMMHIGLDRLDRAGAERLGLFVLSAFIDRDTRLPSEQEANAYAEANADRRFQQWSRYQKDYTREQAFASLKREKLAQYLGSASEHRGILALARHAPAVDAVRMVRGFFRDHSQRTSQCRALLDCLTANPAPAALQLVLAIAKRHKTPGVQRYAGELVAAVAEANSWTGDELADRTVPTGGFDENGIIELAIGETTYRVLLDNDCRITVEKPDGKPVSSLPSPSGDPQAGEAKEAKKRLSAARKEVAQTVELQRLRLYEAMCAGRTWPAADFAEYLLRHPIVSRLIRGLVFAGLDAQGAVTGTFRPLDDGSFTDHGDASVALSAFSAVKLAHRALLDDATNEAWRAHLADYDVKALFEQFDRPVLAIAPDDVERREIVDREGSMLDTFTLRAAATKLGYQRGPGEDGGVFYVYEKRFEAAGIVAVIGFTGSMLPETNMPCALRRLSFVRFATSGAFGKALALAKVPPVLVSETWNDYRAVAAAGSGFDPQWQQKAAF